MLRVFSKMGKVKHRSVDVLFIKKSLAPLEIYNEMLNVLQYCAIKNSSLLVGTRVYTCVRALKTPE